MRRNHEVIIIPDDDEVESIRVETHVDRIVIPTPGLGRRGNVLNMSHYIYLPSRINPIVPMEYQDLIDFYNVVGRYTNPLDTDVKSFKLLVYTLYMQDVAGRTMDPSDRYAAYINYTDIITRAHKEMDKIKRRI